MFLPGGGVLWQDVSMDIIAIWFFLWSKTKYVFLFCMNMKENLVITIWFGFVGDNMTCNNTMLRFAMDFDNGIKGKKIDFTFFWSSMHLFCPICVVVFAFCYFNFNSWKHLFCLIILVNIMFFFLIKGFVCFNLSCNFCICLWVHPNEWTFFLITFLYVWKIIREA